MTPDIESSGDNPDREEAAFDLEDVFDVVETVVLDIEPKARELERRLGEILGPCRGAVDGRWVHVVRRDDGTSILEVSPIDVRDVMAVTRRIDEFVDGGRGTDAQPRRWSRHEVGFAETAPRSALHARRGSRR